MKYDFYLSIMLHAKFKNHRPSGSGKTIFNVFAIYSHGGYLGKLILTICINFRPPFLLMLHVKFSFDWQFFESGFRREDL